MFLFSAWFHLPLPLNHDAAWHFQTALKWLDGAQVGVGVSDINPPMTMWISTPPAILHIATGMDAALAFKLFTYLVLLICFGLTWIVSALGPYNHVQHVLVVGCAVFGMAILPEYHFGQREHLAAAMTLPYVLLAITRAHRAPAALSLALAAGLLAGIGIGIKPYFAALPVLVEIALISHQAGTRQVFRPETIAIALTSAVYVACIWLFAPGYFTEVVPAALTNYHGFNSIAGTMIAALLPPVVILAGIWGFARLSGLPGDFPAFVFPACATAAFLIAAAAQMKGWAYHLFPVWFYLLITAAATGGARPFRPLRMSIAFVLIAYTTASSVVPGMKQIGAPDGTVEHVERLAKIFSEHASENRLVFAFITSPRDIHPAVLMSRSGWVDAWGALVHLPAYWRANRDGLPAAKLKTPRTVAEKRDRALLARLITAKPGVIVTQSGTNRLALEGIGMSYPDYFARYPEFAALWRDYAYLESVGQFDVYIRRR
jgi:hypothetical protein